MIDNASPLDIAALWRLGMMSGEDVAAVCMRWLEADIDGGDADVAAFAGAAGLSLAESAPGFERALEAVAGRAVERDEALLRALRLHLSAALEGQDLKAAIGRLLQYFMDVSDHRLVWNPKRVSDQPDGVYAGQELGLEYVCGGYHAFDDLWSLNAEERAVAEGELMADLREEATLLRDHLSGMLEG